MKQADVKLGNVYAVKVAGRIAPVRLISEAGKGWHGVNLWTGRQINIRTAAKLRKDVSHKYDSEGNFIPIDNRAPD